MESERVRPTRPLRYLEARLSLDKTNVLDIKARASVVPETAEDNGVSMEEVGRGDL